MNQTNKNNVNKTWTLLQTTGGKDEPNVAYREMKRSSPSALYSPPPAAE